MTVFCVNKSMENCADIEINLMDFDGYRPVEFISMDGYDKNDVNGFENPFVKPHENKLPAFDNSVVCVHAAPFSWNVIRFSKI